MDIPDSSNNILANALNVIVYTTKLDDMNIFKEDFETFTTQDVVDSIIEESKPKLNLKRKIKTEYFSDPLDTSFENFLTFLEKYNKKAAHELITRSQLESEEEDNCLLVEYKHEPKEASDSSIISRSANTLIEEHKKRPRGRPRKLTCATQPSTFYPGPLIKRPRGRPRKSTYLIESTHAVGDATEPSIIISSDEDDQESVRKRPTSSGKVINRPRGRPRKSACLIESTHAMENAAEPAIIINSDQDDQEGVIKRPTNSGEVIKRPRGRPRKSACLIESTHATENAAEPSIIINSDEDDQEGFMKRPSSSGEVIKRPRGRPRKRNYLGKLQDATGPSTSISGDSHQIPRRGRPRKLASAPLPGIARIMKHVSEPLRINTGEENIESPKECPNPENTQTTKVSVATSTSNTGNEKPQKKLLKERSALDYSVFRSLFFYDRQKKEVETYILDEDHFVTTYKRFKTWQDLEVYANYTKIFLCCWNRRENIVSTFKSYPLKTLALLRRPHECPLKEHKCICCCAPYHHNRPKVSRMHEIRQSERLPYGIPQNWFRILNSSNRKDESYSPEQSSLETKSFLHSISILLGDNYYHISSDGLIDLYYKKSSTNNIFDDNYSARTDTVEEKLTENICCLTKWAQYFHHLLAIGVLLQTANFIKDSLHSYSNDSCCCATLTPTEPLKPTDIDSQIGKNPKEKPTEKKTPKAAKPKNLSTNDLHVANPHESGVMFYPDKSVLMAHRRMAKCDPEKPFTSRKDLEVTIKKPQTVMKILERFSAIRFNIKGSVRSSDVTTCAYVPEENVTTMTKTELLLLNHCFRLINEHVFNNTDGTNTCSYYNQSISNTKIISVPDMPKLEMESATANLYDVHLTTMYSELRMLSDVKVSRYVSSFRDYKNKFNLPKIKVNIFDEIDIK